MSLASGRRDHRRLAAVSAALVFAFATLLLCAVRAQAAETLIWNNYSPEPPTVGFANIDGSGGGLLNLNGASFDSPEGMAYDSVTNRLYVANDSPGDGQISFVNLDGSGAGKFTAPGAPVAVPEGITLDPAARTLYWINTKPTPDTISWARLDGSAGGLLNLAGSGMSGAFRLAIDSVAGRVYWGDSPAGEPARVAYANTDNTGGGILDLSGATAPASISGIAVDEVGRRVYWFDSDLDKISFASLAGGGGGDVSVPSSIDNAYGLGFDPSLGKVLWGNYVSLAETKASQFGYALTAGGGGEITVTSTQTWGVQDPIVLKSPSGTGTPTVARSTSNRAELTCSQGSWGGDFPGGFVYRAPRTFAYQWTLNGAPVAGATAPTLLTSQAGSYACTVTATNQAGSTSQTASASVVQKAAKVALATKKKARVMAGGVATFRVSGVNEGDFPSSAARVCVKLPRKAKGALRAKPKCKPLGSVAATAKDSTKLRIKVGESASGTYKVAFQVKGSAGQAVKAKIVVLR